MRSVRRCRVRVWEDSGKALGAFAASCLRRARHTQAVCTRCSQPTAMNILNRLPLALLACCCLLWAAQGVEVYEWNLRHAGRHGGSGAGGSAFGLSCLWGRSSSVVDGHDAPASPPGLELFMARECVPLKRQSASQWARVSDPDGSFEGRPDEELPLVAWRAGNGHVTLMGHEDERVQSLNMCVLRWGAAPGGGDATPSPPCLHAPSCTAPRFVRTCAGSEGFWPPCRCPCPRTLWLARRGPRRRCATWGSACGSTVSWQARRKVPLPRW